VSMRRKRTWIGKKHTPLEIYLKVKEGFPFP
jgi:hypothetical protein